MNNLQMQFLNDRTERLRQLYEEARRNVDRYSEAQVYHTTDPCFFWDLFNLLEIRP